MTGFFQSKRRILYPHTTTSVAIVTGSSRNETLCSNGASRKLKIADCGLPGYLVRTNDWNYFLCFLLLSNFFQKGSEASQRSS